MNLKEIEERFQAEKQVFIESDFEPLWCWENASIDWLISRVKELESDDLYIRGMEIGRAHV